MSARNAPEDGATAGFDRAGDERSDAALVDALRADPATRVLVVRGDRVSLTPDSALELVPPAAVTGHRVVWALLGRLDGVAVLLAASAAQPAEETTGSPLRAVAAALVPAEAELAVTGVALGRWLLDAPYCPACGELTDLVASGWARHCPRCGREHFPRTDPAVIAAVRHPTDPDLLLLGANAAWEQRRYSCFAGFVEAGESLEQTLVREIREEAGITVGDVDYRGSQAWPYPRSLMLGFLVRALDAAAQGDGEEIVEVRWFHRDEIGRALAGESDLLLPGPSSIAYRLITAWHAERP